MLTHFKFTNVFHKSYRLEPLRERIINKNIFSANYV